MTLVLRLEIPPSLFCMYTEDSNTFSPGGFSLQFLKVITTMTAYCQAKATFTKCYHCTDVACQGPTSCLYSNCFAIKQ